MIHDQNKIVVFGITGILGAGKSTLAKKMVPNWTKQYRSLEIIEVDDIRRYALWVSNESTHADMRKELGKAFNLSTGSLQYWLNRKELTDKIFEKKENLELFSKITTPVFKRDVEKKIKSNNLDKAIVWAMLLEEGYDNLINSVIMLVNTSMVNVEKRIQKDSIDEAKSRIKMCPDFSQKLQLCKTKKYPYMIVDNNIEIGNLDIYINQILY